MENWDDFDSNISLWNIVSNGSGIAELKKLCEYIHNEHPHKMPSVLITGSEGKKTHARALINSLCLEDVRICPARYFEVGIPSRQVFKDHIYNSAVVIEDILELRPQAEATLWQFLKLGVCAYWSPFENMSDFIYANGLILLTLNDSKKISKTIADGVDFTINIELYSVPQIESILAQRLRFLGVKFDPKIIKTLAAVGTVKGAIEGLRKSLLSLRAAGAVKLTQKYVANADKITT